MKLSNLKKIIRESIKELQLKDTSKNLLNENCVAETWTIECLCSINSQTGEYIKCDGSAWISSSCDTGHECACCGDGGNVTNVPTMIHKKHK